MELFDYDLSWLDSQLNTYFQHIKVEIGDGDKRGPLALQIAQAEAALCELICKEGSKDESFWQEVSRRRDSLGGISGTTRTLHSSYCEFKVRPELLLSADESPIAAALEVYELHGSRLNEAGILEYAFGDISRYLKRSEMAAAAYLLADAVFQLLRIENRMTVAEHGARVAAMKNAIQDIRPAISDLCRKLTREQPGTETSLRLKALKAPRRQVAVKPKPKKRGKYSLVELDALETCEVFERIRAVVDFLIDRKRIIPEAANTALPQGGRRVKSANPQRGRKTLPGGD